MSDNFEKTYIDPETGKKVKGFWYPHGNKVVVDGKTYKELEVYGGDEITCPFCEEEVTNDSWECADYGEATCEECEKEFSYERSVEVTYDSFGLGEQNDQ